MYKKNIMNANINMNIYYIFFYRFFAIKIYKKEKRLIIQSLSQPQCLILNTLYSFSAIYIAIIDYRLSKDISASALMFVKNCSFF